MQRLLYIHAGVSINVPNEPFVIGSLVTINCTTDSPADSISLLRDGQLVDDITGQVLLVHTIPLVNDSIHNNTFRCEAQLTGRANYSDITFDSVNTTVEGTYVYVFIIKLNSPCTFCSSS